MDARTFDRWTVAIAYRPSRRTALRLLAGSLVAGLLPRWGVAPVRAAQRSDRDEDGLYDDDETEIYGTNPDVSDTDGDGSGDGDEVYYGTDPVAADGGAGTATLTGDAGEVTGDGGVLGPVNDVDPGSQDIDPSAPVCPAERQCAAGCCPEGAVCLNGTECCTENVAERCTTLDVQCGEWPGLCGRPVNCGSCSRNTQCRDGGCNTCRGLGVECNTAADCCQGNYGVGCCFDGVSLTTRCTDVTNSGSVCPGEPVGPVTCAAGLTDCGGQCFNLAIAQFNCGTCGYSCGLAGGCRGGVCTPFTADPTDPGMEEPDEPVEPMEPAVSEAEREEILSGGGGGGAGGGASGGGGGPCEIEGACGDPSVTHEDERNTNTPPQG